MGADLVVNDDELGGRIAADHLLRLGHRRLGHLTGTGGPAVHRRTGFINELASAGLETHVTGTGRGTSEEDGYPGAGELVDRDPEITAIFAANVTMGLGALAAIRQRGMSVLTDVSVVGYDNSPIAQSRYLAITSIDDRSGVGAVAGRPLLDRGDMNTTVISGNTTDAPTLRYLDARQAATSFTVAHTSRSEPQWYRIRR